MTRILMIGVTAAGADSLPSNLNRRVMAADLLVGGQRQLGYFSHFTGETITIGADIEPVAARLQTALEQGQQVVVLASGDPLCYGIGASLRRYFAPEVLEIIPAPSAFQLAFAALAEPWHDAALLSAHARPLAEVVARVQIASKAAILTDNRHTPAVIAQALLQAGLSGNTFCAICENLGGGEQRVIRTTLAEVGGEYAPLNVFVVMGRGSEEARARRDEEFSTTDGQITKREIRILSLAELALGPGEVMWDIGAGSGAVGIEAAHAQPTATVYAVEKRAEMCRHLQENLNRFPTPNLHWLEGTAPEAIADWPNPHSVFIGGSGGYLPEIIQVAQQRLHSGGRLVINLATLENLATVRSALPQAQIIQAQINRAIPILDMLRFEALNPVFIVSWSKEK